MEKFRGVDYYGIETLLSEDERMIRDAVRDWVEAEFIPIVPEHHRAGTFPIALIPKLGELGVFGATLNGTKLWITNGSIADVAVVWAKTEDGEIRGFLVEKGTPGFSTLDIHGKFSMRASITSELAFQDCRIPLDNLLPNVKGLRGPLGCLSQARYGIAWGAVGALMACYDWALQYAQQRVQFGKPIGSFQLVQQKLVWMLNEITKAQLLVLQLGRLKDAGTVRPQQVSLAKMNNVQAALDGARMARDILGAAGIVDEHPVIRHMLNLETVNTYEGTHDIHALIVGRDVTGLDAFGAA